MKKIALCIRKSFQSRLGGDSIQVMKTKEFLEKKFDVLYMFLIIVYIMMQELILKPQKDSKYLLCRQAFIGTTSMLQLGLFINCLIIN